MGQIKYACRMRQTVRPFLPLLLAASLGCSPSGGANGAPSATPSARPEDVAAEVGGRRITLEEVDRRAAGRRPPPAA
jgi:hypothetical protein